MTKYWFKPKSGGMVLGRPGRRFDFTLVPISWEGWLATGLCVLGIHWGVRIALHGHDLAGIALGAGGMVGSLVALLLIAWGRTAEGE